MNCQDAYEAYDDHGELLPTVGFKTYSYMGNSVSEEAFYRLYSNQSKLSDWGREPVDNIIKIGRREKALDFIIPYLIGMIVGCGIMIVWGAKL